MIKVQLKWVLVTGVLVAIVIVALTTFHTSQIKKEKQKLYEYKEKVSKDLKEEVKKNIEFSKKITELEGEIESEKVINNANRDTVERLRNQTKRAYHRKGNAPSTTDKAYGSKATAFGELFNECIGKYEEMGRKADEHLGQARLGQEYAKEIEKRISDE